MADLAKIRRAAKAREDSEERFREAIRAAYATERWSLSELAEAAGVTKQRCWQIVHGRR